MILWLFFFNDTATTEIYTLSLHDALPTSCWKVPAVSPRLTTCFSAPSRSEEHTSELQSRGHLVCRLLLEKKKKNTHEQRTKTTQTMIYYKHTSCSE